MSPYNCLHRYMLGSQHRGAAVRTGGLCVQAGRSKHHVQQLLLVFVSLCTSSQVHHKPAAPSLWSALLACMEPMRLVCVLASPYMTSLFMYLQDTPGLMTRRTHCAWPGSSPKHTFNMHTQVHYDCIYRGLDVVSSRSARLLGGNRTVAEVRYA